MLCKLETIKDIILWSQSEPVKRFLLEQFQIVYIPKRSQFYNILGYVNPKKFREVFINWMKWVLADEMAGKTIAFDGKTICSTDKLSDDGNPLHILSAIISECDLVIGSISCDTKIEEPKAFRELIKMLDISGAMVVADALHCNKTSAKEVVEEGGDYLFVVKDNHENLKDDIETYFQNPPKEVEKHKTIEKNGGRIEKRTAYVEHEIDWVYGKKDWAKLACIGAIHREFEKNGKKTSEWHYYISSKALTAENLLKHARLEWAVESMHWMLDVHWNEDKTRVWDMNIQENLNIMRKIALNMAREFKAKSDDKYLAISTILKRNLFDVNNLFEFLRFFFALFAHNCYIFVSKLD